MKTHGWICICAALFLAAPASFAQSRNASLYGTVRAASGAPVPKVAVTATNIKTGVALPTVTNDSGLYIFPSLLPGEYKVSAEAPGFRKEVAEHIELDVTAKITIDLKLE